MELPKLCKCASTLLGMHLSTSRVTECKHDFSEGTKTMDMFEAFLGISLLDVDVVCFVFIFTLFVTVEEQSLYLKFYKVGK